MTQIYNDKKHSSKLRLLMDVHHTVERYYFKNTSLINNNASSFWVQFKSITIKVDVYFNNRLIFSLWYFTVVVFALLSGVCYSDWRLRKKFPVFLLLAVHWKIGNVYDFRLKRTWKQVGLKPNPKLTDS